MNQVPTDPPVLGIVQARRMAKYEFELYPHLWERVGHSKIIKKLKWRYVFFNEGNKAEIPKSSGIYMFIVAPRHAYIRDHTYIFYVGKAVNLYERYYQYQTEQLGEDLAADRERIVDFLNRFKGHIYFNYLLCPESDLETHEDYLVDHIYPWANTRHRKSAKAKLLTPQTV